MFLLGAGVGEAGEEIGLAGTGLQLGAGAVIYNQTGNAAPLQTAAVPYVLGMIAPLPSIISDPASNAIQNEVAAINHSAGPVGCH